MSQQPLKQKPKPYAILMLWVKFRPEHQERLKTKDGCISLKTKVANAKQEEYQVARYKRILENQYRGRYFQARIYRHPGNDLIYKDHPYEDQTAKNKAQPSEAGTGHQGSDARAV